MERTEARRREPCRAHAGTYIGLGERRERNHQLASAWSAYRTALARVSDAEKRDYASARITVLEPRLSSPKRSPRNRASIAATRSDECRP
jgi:hypothetical protein